MPDKHRSDDGWVIAPGRSGRPLAAGRFGRPPAAGRFARSLGTAAFALTGTATPSVAITAAAAETRFIRDIVVRAPCTRQPGRSAGSRGLGAGEPRRAPGHTCALQGFAEGCLTPTDPRAGHGWHPSQR